MTHICVLLPPRIKVAAKRMPGIRFAGTLLLISSKTQVWPNFHLEKNSPGILTGAANELFGERSILGDMLAGKCFQSRIGPKFKFRKIKCWQISVFLSFSSNRSKDSVGMQIV